MISNSLVSCKNFLNDGNYHNIGHDPWLMEVNLGVFEYLVIQNVYEHLCHQNKTKTLTKSRI